MKHSLFIFSLAALTLASCSQDEVIDVNNSRLEANRIGFRVRSGKHSRSMEYSTANLDKFSVYAWHELEENALDDGVADKVISYFDGDLPVFFSKNDVNIFTSAVPYYYPTDGSLLYFRAFAPYTLDMKAAPLAGLTLDYTVESDITKQEDIILGDSAANQDREEDEADPIELTFFHALTKVFISKVMNSDTRYKYEIAGIKFGNISNSGHLFFQGEYSMNREDVVNGTVDANGYVSDPTNGWIFWKPTTPQSSDMVYIFDEPLVLDKENTSVYPMTGNDTGAEDVNGFQDGAGKGGFMLIPQKLSSTFVDDQTSGSLEGKDFQAGMSYIALLVRITYLPTGTLVYPYAEGVEAISETIGEGEDAVTYAWAAFPVASLWRPSTYVDYTIDFTHGAGFVAPGASDEWVLKPILGREIKFTEDVWNWMEYTNEDINHNGSNYTDGGNVEDPFLE